MVIQSEQERIRDLLARALPLLCRSGLSFSSEFSIEALIGITLDKNDVFLVSINETVKSDGDGGDRSISINLSCVDEHSSQSRKRKLSKNSSVCSDTDDDVHDLDGKVMILLFVTFVGDSRRYFFLTCGCEILIF